MFIHDIMKQGTLVFLAVSLITLQANTCKQDPACGSESHNVITIKNLSSRRVNYALYENCPDTIITDEHNPSYYSFKPMEQGETVSRGIGMGGCWESSFKSIPKDWIYFFDEDSLAKIPWEVVKATNRGVLERRELTIDYLKQNNFVVAHP